MRVILEVPGEAPSLRFCRHVLRALLEELAFDTARAFDIELVLCEAVANVIRHAHAGAGQSCQVSVEVAADRLVLRVIDQGCGFTPRPRAAPAGDQIAGRGLWLIERLADRSQVRTAPGKGCQLEAEFALPESPAS